jgi:hypothetical protein
MDISRAELYALVWAHPLSEIARFYGVPAMKVAQACDAYDIARPPAGYWQKVTFGKATTQPAFVSKNYAPDQMVAIERLKADNPDHAGNGMST